MSPEDLFNTGLNGDPIDALAAIIELRELLAQAQHDHVLTLRRHGASWAFIAPHLGVTRQAVQEKYGPWDPRKP